MSAGRRIRAPASPSTGLASERLLKREEHLVRRYGQHDHVVALLRQRTPGEVNPFGEPYAEHDRPRNAADAR